MDSEEIPFEDLPFGERIQYIQFATGKTRNSVREWRDPGDGHRIKATKDEATTRGNIVIEHNTKDDRVDVNIRPDVAKWRTGDGAAH